MLAEITIRNFAIIDEVTVRLAPRLNVVTGETGAGKSIMVDALAAVLGERTSPDMVRGGESSALIEAFFELDERLATKLQPILEEQGLTGDDPTLLILAREIRAEGRSIARVNGRVTAAAVVRQLGEILVDIHGQTEHLSLLRVPEHLNFLDRYAHLGGLRAEMATLTGEANRLRAEIAAIRDNSQARERRLERLRYEVDEIAAARLAPDEEEELRTERTRLANAERLTELIGAAYDAVYAGSGETPAAADLLGQALGWLLDLERIDPSLKPERERIEQLTEGLEDVARGLRQYRDSVEASPARLDEVEERLGLIANLKRKYGSTIPEILAYAERAQAELAQLTGGEEQLAELEHRLDEVMRSAAGVAAELSRRRKEAAIELAQGVERQLADLAMERARFEVGFNHQPDEDGLEVDGEKLAFDRTGVDRVEFLLAPNPGEPMRPLARIASGGENSRLMLALKTVLSQADDTPTLIFDEIDTGIGGRLGHVVGEKLAGLAEHHQVLCVTHLPQLAAFADVHLTVGKEVRDGRTRTVVKTLSREERLAELANMLGGISPGTLRSADEMLQRVHPSS
ncbi:MAG: DNA repair protein RecN [Anaerolineae bacterium]|jgi:DNA repair protein RecN (Recombination protein N)